MDTAWSQQEISTQVKLYIEAWSRLSKDRLENTNLPLMGNNIFVMALTQSKYKMRDAFIHLMVL